MIYAIQAGEDGPIKFGVAAVPTARVRELQTGNAAKLRLVSECAVADGIEALIHYHLRAERMQGEWFRNTVKVWQCVWALERQAMSCDHEIIDHVYHADYDAILWYRQRLGITFQG